MTDPFGTTHYDRTGQTRIKEESESQPRPMPEFSPDRARLLAERPAHPWTPPDGVVGIQIEEARGDVVERNRAAFDEEIREAHTIARRRESQ